MVSEAPSASEALAVYYAVGTQVSKDDPSQRQLYVMLSDFKSSISISWKGRALYYPRERPNASYALCICTAAPGPCLARCSLRTRVQTLLSRRPRSPFRRAPFLLHRRQQAPRRWIRGATGTLLFTCGELPARLGHMQRKHCNHVWYTTCRVTSKHRTLAWMVKRSFA